MTMSGWHAHWHTMHGTDCAVPHSQSASLAFSVLGAVHQLMLGMGGEQQLRKLNFEVHGKVRQGGNACAWHARARIAHLHAAGSGGLFPGAHRGHC